MALIRLKNVTVSYPIFTQHTQSLKTALLSRLGGTIANYNDTVIVQALNNLNLELKDGDRLGIVGPNGAGKTTLLRVASRVYEPQSGTVEIEGSVSCFTDLTLGMDPEATGWENIIFRCIFMGLTFTEARQISPSIADFCELGDYLNMPVRTYSAGMFIRLAFAISTSIQPDIIIMDELIGAGDAQFFRKAQKRLEDLLGSTKILVIASHSEKIIADLCNKALWLEHGCVKEFGPAEDVVGQYLKSVGGPRPKPSWAKGHSDKKKKKKKAKTVLAADGASSEPASG
jgi:ABC-type polysaccharide/polyol phosphate transport system ATPase subunit